MNPKLILATLTAVLLTTIAASAQTPIAEWTFDVSQPTTAGPYAPEIGPTNAAATAFGQTSITDSAGNPSSGKSFSGPGWDVGDYWQFKVSTLGLTGINVSFDQEGSGTGPRLFALEYSTNGVDFTKFGSDISLGATASTWVSSSTDLSSITALNNATNIYLRVADDSTTSIAGGTVGTGGTSRIDNVLVTASGIIAVSGPPVIFANPASTNGIAGRTFTLNVTASGTGPLSYQWYFPNLSTPLQDGSIVSGSTTSTLTLSGVTTNQTGNYQVIITNVSGSATSTVAFVNVKVPVVTNIAYVRTLQDPVNWALTDSNTLFTVQGTVTTYVNMTTAPNKEYFIQDGTGGIAVFINGGGVVPDAGSLVQVTGPLGQFRGLLEMNLVNSNPDHSANILSTGNPLPAPLPFSFSSLANIPYMEANEGSLIVVSNVFLGFTNASFTAAAVTLTNLSGQTFPLFVNAAETDILGQSVPPFASAITGILSQFKSAAPFTSGYELDITHAQDLVAGTPPPSSIPLYIQRSGGGVVLTWSDPSFSLQAASTATGPYTNIPAASSPYPDPITGSARFYRLSQ